LKRDVPKKERSQSSFFFLNTEESKSGDSPGIQSDARAPW